MSGQAIGFIGIGNIGWLMAANLATKGHSLTVSDVAPGRAEEFAKQFGAKIAPSNAALARESDVVILMLPTSAIDEKVLTEENGVLVGLRQGALVLEMTSANPSKTRELAAKVKAKGGTLIDAPVSGGLPRAKSGELSIMVGGDEADIKRAEPVLRCMGTTIARTGGTASAHAMKALNNLMSAAGYLIGVETLLIGKKFGLDLPTMVDIINVSTGVNSSTQRKFKQMVFTRTFDDGFGLDLMVKDVSIAMEIAKDTNTPAPFSNLCREIWAGAQQMLGPGHTHTEMAKLLEMMAGTELK